MEGRNGNVPALRILLCGYATEKLFGIMLCVGIPCINHVKGMGLRDPFHGKCTDVAFFGNNRVVQKTDTDPTCNQGLDGNEAADGYFSVKVTELITGCDQPLFKNAARAGALPSISFIDKETEGR